MRGGVSITFLETKTTLRSISLGTAHKPDTDKSLFVHLAKPNPFSLLPEALSAGGT